MHTVFWEGVWDKNNEDKIDENDRVRSVERRGGGGGGGGSLGLASSLSRPAAICQPSSEIMIDATFTFRLLAAGPLIFFFK